MNSIVFVLILQTIVSTHFKLSGLVTLKQPMTIKNTTTCRLITKTSALSVFMLKLKIHTIVRLFCAIQSKFQATMSMLIRIRAPRCDKTTIMSPILPENIGIRFLALQHMQVRNTIRQTVMRRNVNPIFDPG